MSSFTLGLLLGTFAIVYHCPSIYGAALIPIPIVGALQAALPWWGILIHVPVGIVSALVLILKFRTTAPSEPPINLLAMPVSRPRFVMRWISAFVASLSYGFLYYLDIPTARLVDPSHVLLPWPGPAISLCISICIDALMSVARRAWVGRPQYTPPIRSHVFTFLCLIAVCIDLSTHAEHWSTPLIFLLPLLFGLQLYIAERFE